MGSLIVKNSQATWYLIVAQAGQLSELFRTAISDLQLAAVG